METMAFLGCTRGLGQSVTLEMERQKTLSRSLLMARSAQGLQDLAGQLSGPAEIQRVDFSKPDSVEVVMQEIRNIRPQRIFYFAGGGPHGLFSDKEWKDHLWALQVSFLTPSEILHRVLREAKFDFVKQVVFVGSRIADDRPDPLASSYASAKHGLRGLVESLQGEDLSLDLRFFRPGYMNTDLLPKNAKPRQEGQILAEPAKVAADFAAWALDPSGEAIYDAFA